MGKQFIIPQRKKRKNLAKEKTYETKVIELEKTLDETDCLQEKKQLLEEINEVRNDLDEIYNQKVQGMLIRSKAKWMEEGEKPTKYFFNLEARHFLNKAIMELEKNDGTILNDISDIINETKHFYQKLYSKQDVTPIDLHEYFSDIEVPKLTSEEALNLEGDLTLSELTQALKQMKNEKSPGPDGFTTEFLKFFWKDLGVFLCKSLNSGYKNGNLSTSLKQGMITCIPKGNKPKKTFKKLATPRTACAN